MSLEDINTMAEDRALALLEPLVERSPWVAMQALAERPFRRSIDLERALISVIRAAGVERQRALFQVHPELAGREARAGTMTDASHSEQGRLGLLALTGEEAARLARLNAAYRERFGYPFIVALHRLKDLDGVFQALEARLDAPAAVEHETTLGEIASVIRMRIAALLVPAALAPESEPRSSVAEMSVAADSKE